MKTNFNISKLKENSTNSIKKIFELKESNTVDQGYNILIDFKKLPTGIYHLIRSIMDIEMEVLESNFLSNEHLADNKINFIVVDSQIQKTNIYKNIYSDFIMSLIKDLENYFNGQVKFNLGTKLLSMSTYLNLKNYPDFRKVVNAEDTTIIKIIEKNYLNFLNNLERINFKPFISKKIILKKNEEDLFNLTIDFLPNNVHINLKVSEELNGEDLELFKLNIIEIEKELNREYSKDSPSYFTISKMAFDVKYSSGEDHNRTIYGFLNALSNAIMIFFKAEHKLLFIQNKDKDFIYISNDCKNKVQKDFLNRNAILIGYGEFSLANLVNISYETMNYSSNKLKNIVNYLLIEGKSS